MSAQVGVVIHGRVEDALSRGPVPGVQIFSPDSSAVAYTDSLGAFAIQVGADAPLAVQAERLGYLSDRFELAVDAPSRVSILLLQPSPIEVEGITASDERAITTLVENLERRRNAYSGAMRAFDRARLEGEIGTVLEFVQTRRPWIFQCDSDLNQMCVRARGRTIANPNPQNRVLVCVDGVESFAPFSELGNMPIQSVALVELFGSRGDEVRVYTPDWMLSRARTGRTSFLPIGLPTLFPVC